MAQMSQARTSQLQKRVKVLDGICDKTSSNKVRGMDTIAMAAVLEPQVWLSACISCAHLPAARPGAALRNNKRERHEQLALLISPCILCGYLLWSWECPKFSVVALAELKKACAMCRLGD